MKEAHEKLMRAKPVKVEEVSISLPTLGEIFDFGLSTYLEYLQSIIIDVSKLDIDDRFLQGRVFSDYEIFLLLVLTSEDFKNTFFEAMQYFTGDTFVMDEGVIVSLKTVENADGEEKLIFHQFLTENFWTQIRKVLTLAHWQEEPDRYDSMDAKARKIMEKIKRNKEEVQRIKAKRGESTSLELYELIGSVCSHSKVYSLLNVWQLTYYQFFDHYYRLNINDEYHYSLQSILAGADPKKVKIEHWASSIKKT